MKVSTSWDGATFTPENKEDIKVLERMEMWEVTNGGEWSRQDDNSLTIYRAD